MSRKFHFPWKLYEEEQVDKFFKNCHDYPGSLKGYRGAEDPMSQDRKENSLKAYREQLFMTKAELARKAGISPLTVDRIERGISCRLETKRKIILALGLELSEAGKIFGDDN